MANGLVGTDHAGRAKEWRDIAAANRIRAKTARAEGQHKIANDCDAQAREADAYAETYERAS